jgi:hypothetical protein
MYDECQVLQIGQVASSPLLELPMNNSRSVDPGIPGGAAQISDLSHLSALVHFQTGKR